MKPGFYLDGKLIIPWTEIENAVSDVYFHRLPAGYKFYDLLRDKGFAHCEHGALYVEPLSIADFFDGCDDIETVGVADTYFKIPFRFNNCDNIKKIVLNQYTEDLPQSLMIRLRKNAVNLEIEIPKDNPHFTRIGNIVYSKSLAYAHFLLNDEKSHIELLPQTVAIDARAFAYARIKSISGENVTNIYTGAFGFSTIEEVDFPKLQNVGTSAFEFCKNLKNICLTAFSLGYDIFSNTDIKNIYLLNENIDVDFFTAIDNSNLVCNLFLNKDDNFISMIRDEIRNNSLAINVEKLTLETLLDLMPLTQANSVIKKFNSLEEESR